MDCRPGCGACCIAPSISSAIPGMDGGKPAGVRCIHLTGDMRCAIFNDPGRPAVCELFKAETAICGSSRDEALGILSELEKG